jgi:REP element-mobilizing transposase RayT
VTDDTTEGPPGEPASLPPRRRSLRLSGYDYSQAGGYFVTICTRDRVCLFGQVCDDCVDLNPLGRVVEESWHWLGRQYEQVALDASVVMPNHFHGVMLLRQDEHDSRKPLGRLVGAFKTVSTKRMNELRRTPGATVWQRNYYEHVIRHETDLDRIRRYIVENPARWALDRENPEIAEGSIRFVNDPRT